MYICISIDPWRAFNIILYIDSHIFNNVKNFYNDAHNKPQNRIIKISQQLMKKATKIKNTHTRIYCSFLKSVIKIIPTYKSSVIFYQILY